MADVSSNESPDILEAASLLEKIAENPYEYDNHVAYIALLRKIGDTEDLHQAREVFHSLYPFSEGMLSRVEPLADFFIRTMVAMA